MGLEWNESHIEWGGPWMWGQSACYLPRPPVCSAATRIGGVVCGSRRVPVRRHRTVVMGNQHLTGRRRNGFPSQPGTVTSAIMLHR